MSFSPWVEILLVVFGLLFSVTVPVQRSSVSHSVPRTVALELRPRVRNRPCARPNRRRRVFAAALIGFAARAAAAHPSNVPPVSVRSVRPSLLRWVTTNAPWEKVPLWVRFELSALVSLTLPFEVSIVEPIFTIADSRSLKRLPWRGLTITVPPPGLRRTVL